MAWLTCVRVLPGLWLYIETEDGHAAELDVHAFIDGFDELRILLCSRAYLSASLVS